MSGACAVSGAPRAPLRRLRRSDFPSDTLTLARYLLGKWIVRRLGARTVAVRIAQPYGPMERLGLIPLMKKSAFQKKYSVVFISPNGRAIAFARTITGTLNMIAALVGDPEFTSWNRSRAPGGSST